MDKIYGPKLKTKKTIINYVSGPKEPKLLEHALKKKIIFFIFHSLACRGNAIFSPFSRFTFSTVGRGAFLIQLQYLTEKAVGRT